MGWSASDAIAHLRKMGVPNPLPVVCGEPRKRSKYNVDLSEEGKARRTADGILFGSELEKRHYLTLKIAEKHGLVAELRLQPRYKLQDKFTDSRRVRHRAIWYVGDFEFLRDGQRICADSKGREAPGFRNKWKMAIAKYPEITFEVWTS